MLPANLGPTARGGFTTRHGGVSLGAYAAADGSGGRNLAHHVGDEPGAVRANREQLAEVMGACVVWMDQEHGRRGHQLTMSEPVPPHPVDALLDTGHAPTGRALGVLVADCVPLLLASRDGAVTMAVHIGRQGLLAGIVPAVLRGAAPHTAVPELYASLGPSICGACYELPESIVTEVSDRVPASRSRSRWDTPALDVAAGVEAQLRGAGLQHIQRHRHCTVTDPRFYSYRRDGRTGRFAGVVAGDTP